MLPTFIPNHCLHPTFLWSVRTYHLPLSFQTVFVISDDVRKQTMNLLHASVLRRDTQRHLSLIIQQLKTEVNYLLHFYILAFMWPCLVTNFLIIKPTRCTNFSNLFWKWNYMFRTVSLSIIRSYSLYTQQSYMSYRFVDSFRAGSGWNCSSTNLYDIYLCWMYSE
jgi:hypothetical protein